jgi:predicted alpha/beta-hydrolase family hydrolase
MTEATLHIDVPGSGPITAIRTEPEGTSAGWTFVYAPGAGANVHDPFGVYACRRLAGEGIAAVRFQFPYQEARKRGPDRPPVLEATWRAVIESVRSPGARLVIGGRSMGGRIGSHVVAQGVEVDALALFAYPLRPPGKPDQLRDKHLPSIDVPTLFCSGTRDAFASPDELRAAASKVPRSTVHLLDGADHGFSVPKSTGRTKEDVYANAVAALLTWLRELGP